ncbi:hypothetical protein HDV04_004363 [Boothiomyces sp. JEL0838]|nr:hypothetical protein HDV04_004363 [Boothiomyces sp. JEL0838]
MLSKRERQSIVERNRRARTKVVIQELKELVPTSAKQEGLQQLYILENAATYIRRVQQVLKANGLMIEEEDHFSPSPVYSNSTFTE